LNYTTSSSYIISVLRNKYLEEVLMNIFTINSTSVLSRCVRFIGAMMAIALTMPAAAFSQTVYPNPATVDLLTAGNYRALSGTTLNIAAGCTVTGNVGGVAVTNNGTVTGTTDIGNAAVTTALNDLTAAKNDLAGRTPDDGSLIVELAGKTLGRGVYAGPGTFGLNGILTLTGVAGDRFIFKTTTTLITGTTCIVNLTGGALASDVYWQVGSSATIDGDFKGNILAGTYITQNGGTIDGRTLGLTAVTLGGTSVLPVELTSFTAAFNNSAVELNWNTASEVNNYGFEVQRLAVSYSLLAKSQQLNANSSEDWVKLGFVQGHGNSNSPKDYSFEDKNPQVGKLQYRLKQIDFDGAFEYSDVVEVNFDAPVNFVLGQNYPNPFNPETVISYQLPVGGLVTLKVYDLLGREIATLVNEYKTAGTYNSQFSIRNFQLPGGVYFYSINAGEYKSTKKMILLK
jgi:hypothetical protein